MPTPVSVARQCLAAEAVAALDEAVAVAKRRCHAQTTSLHAVSALLYLPSSTIREACTRSRSSACSPRLQFRALELCVGVALDRISVLKSSSAVDEPPVSNSLMAAIKRSQANQRRHPDTFHLYKRQQLCSDSQNFLSISAVKVEMKHFIMSILDDPIVSRVFSDAGFRTNEIKWAILNPLPVSRLSSPLAASRCPPLFRCSLSDIEPNKLLSDFPFSVDFPAGTEKVDENSRRVGEILLNRDRRNPLLIGACADDALRNFIDCLNRKEPGVVPKEIDGLSVFSVEQELTGGGMSEDMIELKFKQVDEMVENSQGPGIIVNCGDFKSFVDVEPADDVNRMVSELKRLLINSGGKLWVIGYLANDDVYKKLQERFPTIEMDWGLHLLPVTSSTGAKRFKSSLMGSFVPLGGFFSMPSDLEAVRTTATQSSSLCNLCNEKYETEVSSIMRETPTGSIAISNSVNLPSWLSTTQGETSNKSDVMEAKDYSTVLDARVRALKRKWNEICQRLHCSSINQEDISKAKLQMWNLPSLYLNSSNTTNLSPCMPTDLQKSYLSKKNYPKPVLLEDDVAAEEPVQGIDTNALHKPSPPQASATAPSVTTDLGLGTFYASRSNESTSSQVSDKHMYMKGLEHPWNVLAEKCYWQIDAIQSIGRTVSRCRNGNGKYPFSRNGNIWLSFHGPDKVGKMKIAAALAELVLGGKEKLLCLDFRSEDMDCSHNSMFGSYDLNYQRLKSGRKMIVDCLAEELSKRPNSVIVLENIEKADIFVQGSLLQAIKTGKFPDSHGRDVLVNNVIFVLTSGFLKVTRDRLIGRVESEFPEEKILEAQNLQMQILIRSLDGNHNSAENVSVIPSANKRKLINDESGKIEVSKRCRSMIDLNFPVEDIEGYSDRDECEDGNLETMLEELLENVDGNVVFKPFDFDALAQKIVKEVDVRLKKLAGAKILLEIDRQLMLQILAAAWLTDRNGALEDWIENVLCSTIKDAQQRLNVTSGGVMQLLPCDGLDVEEKANGVWLPSRIHIN